MPGHHHFFCAEWRRLRKVRVQRAALTESRTTPTVSWWQVVVVEDEARTSFPICLRLKEHSAVVSCFTAGLAKSRVR